MSTLREVCAVIRPSRWTATLQALRQAGFSAVTRQRVYGRGRQRGLRYTDEATGAIGGIPVLPKWMLTLVVEDHDVDAAVAAIVGANRSGNIGDGKLFINRVDQALRLSDLSTGIGALSR